MRYAQIRKLDVSNGAGVGISLFVQGCHFHCFNCFNQETWNFDGGKEWTPDVEKRFLELARRPYIKRVSILGGEPLADENVDTVIDLCKKLFGKTVWVYTGYRKEEIPAPIWRRLSHYISYLVDGRYSDRLRNPQLHFRGSSNQRIWRKNKLGEWRIIDFDELNEVNVIG